LRENKSVLIAQKKMQNKEADAISYFIEVENSKGEVVKAESNTDEDYSKLKAVLVINTTKLLDSHGDVHLNGLWKKSVNEQKDILLLQEHQMKFNMIISDNVVASTKTMSWESLGYNFEGSTEALVFNTEIDKDRNEFMFGQYKKGYVKNHSVGMRYVKIDLAINSESKWDEEEKAIWDKYYKEIVNKEVADERGYFWAVTEAKAIEGSAVVKGSNYATPTISIEAVKIDTPIEQKEEPTIEVTQTSKRRRII
jgi:hypothetical protein